MPRVVVITGASRGIGLATARRFADAGDLLVLGDRTAGTDLDSVFTRAAARGGGGFAASVDVANPDEATAFIGSAEQKYGRIDILINNAGILIAVPSHECSWEQWERVIAVNLSGTWSCLRAVLPGMIARKSGRIINVSSELGLIGFPTYAAYSASKGGVIALTKAIAKEVAPLGILVNTVAPGPTVTDMLVKDTAEYNDETRMQIPLRRFGQPEEIAAVIEAIAGEAGNFMVGQVISPNGGTAI